MLKLPPQIEEFQKAKNFPDSEFTTDGSLYKDVTDKVVELYSEASEDTCRRLDNVLIGQVKSDFSSFIDERGMSVNYMFTVHGVKRKQ